MLRLKMSAARMKVFTSLIGTTRPISATVGGLGQRLGHRQAVAMKIKNIGFELNVLARLTHGGHQFGHAAVDIARELAQMIFLTVVAGDLIGAAVDGDAAGAAVARAAAFLAAGQPEIVAQHVEHGLRGIAEELDRLAVDDESNGRFGERHGTKANLARRERRRQLSVGASAEQKDLTAEGTK